MKTADEMTQQEIEAALESIFECTKTVQNIQSNLSYISAELALLNQLKLAYKLIDRGTD